MKNIYILPTDNPNKLILNLIQSKCSNDVLGINDINANWYIMKYQNIYITSDEEIKERDWIYDSSENDIIKRSNFPDINGYIKRFCKKIILTTDQDLIKNGIQPIPDDFLEWFVENPSCEEVEVNTQRIFGRSSPLDTLGQTFITYIITNYEK